MERPPFFNSKYQRAKCDSYWTKDEKLNDLLVERAGYVPIQKRVDAIISAGNRLRIFNIVNNPNGDEELERFFALDFDPAEYVEDIAELSMANRRLGAMRFVEKREKQEPVYKDETDSEVVDEKPTTE